MSTLRQYDVYNFRDKPFLPEIEKFSLLSNFLAFQVQEAAFLVPYSSHTMDSKIDTRAKFWILLYKGFLFRKRHYIVTAFEIIFPVLVASIPAIIYSELGFEVHSTKTHWINATYYDPFKPTDKIRESSQVLLAYAPSNRVTHQLMADSAQIIQEMSEKLFYTPEFRAFKDGEELESYCMVQQRHRRYLTIIGTVFNSMISNFEYLQPNLDYTIRVVSRYSTGFSTNLKHRFTEDYRGHEYSDASYFLAWQAVVEKAFIQRYLKQENKTFNYDLWMQGFPIPGHKGSGVEFAFYLAVPLFILCGFTIFVINLMRKVIEEKSNGSKELFKMMGMTNFVYWSSTFLNYFIVGAVVFFIITIIYKSPMKNSTVFLAHSDFFLLFILFLLFTASLILFCLALTTVFNKATFGTIAIIIIYNVSYSLLFTFVFYPAAMVDTYFPPPRLVKFCICLLPTGAMLALTAMISGFEANGEGVQWSNLYSYDVIPEFNMLSLMLTMLFSCFLFVIIIWYVDAVWPWQYGVPKPFYFPFTKIYWCGYKEQNVYEILWHSEDDTSDSEFFEDDPTGNSPGIVISNLSKVFRNGLQTKVAVKNISLNIYNSQITALLGHNGAGKTTTINILTGMYSPSGGTVSINGWNIFTQSDKARQSLGVCPQRNVLYDTLTVEEHLKIYAALKGVSCNQLDQEINNILNMLNLAAKKSELTKNLSGSMKRKLSLGIAIIGGSKVLFLDEPTSGMDVEARRSTWDILLKIKQNRTIILTTHYMEEADILGDRIAIMSNGEIQCCGSPLYLKKKFGTGYHLHVVKKENFDINAVNGVLARYVPDATLENNYEREATYNLISNTRSNFGALFEEIELNKDTLGINSCGITVTTMEDVFLNVSNLVNWKIKTEEKFSVENADETEMKDIYVESNIFRKSPEFQDQFFGLIMKRMHYAKRHWSMLVPQLILPFVIMCICFVVINLNSEKSFRRESPLKLDIKEIYGETDGFYHSDNDTTSLSVGAKIQKVLQEKNIFVKQVEDPNKYILSYGSKNLVDYYKKMIVGGNVKASNGNLNLTAWFNGFPYHAQPLSLLLMDTAILRYVAKSGNIILTNHPLPAFNTFYAEDSRHILERILANVFVTLALSILSASFVLVPIQERTSKAKLLQMMTGLSPAVYWLSMFVWDFLICAVVSLFLIIPFAIFSHYAFFSPHSEAMGTALLMMLLYGWSSIPFSYVFSLIFKNSKTGFAVINVINVIIGIPVCSIFKLFLLRIKLKGREYPTAKTFSWFLKLFPSYSLSSGFSDLFAISYANAFCESPSDLKFNCAQEPFGSRVRKCCKDICGDKCLVKTYPITMEDCGQDILFLFLDGIFYFALLLFLESAIVKHISCFRKISHNHLVNEAFTEDSDVLQEEERVKSKYGQVIFGEAAVLFNLANGNNYEHVSRNDAAVVLDLTKQFKNIKAVDRLTFGMYEKECFGLLGVNGAGKTTTFRMLTGDCYPTEGNAYIGYTSLTNNLKKFQSHIGYCPQFDALIGRLSAREMITLFARLRGLRGPRLTRYVNALIKMTDLVQYAEKPSMVYSGGNKRKLSIALALIGAPPLLLLDEPTVGVDPVSRRKIWKILSLARIHSGASVILTTHSMEECEALCSRLAIMVNGRFRCLGSVQHLKSKFAQGYTLIIKIKKGENTSQSVDAIKVHIDSNLPGAHLEDIQQGMLQYLINDPSVTLSRLFSLMDNMKNNFILEDYVISDTSLEQLFLMFARSQRDV